MRPRHLREFPPAPSDDQLIQRIIAILAGMPRPMVADILVFLEFWILLPRRARAVLAKCVQPNLSDQETARIAGVQPRTLKGYGVYQSVKLRLDDYLETKRRQDYTMPELNDSTVQTGNIDGDFFSGRA